MENIILTGAFQESTSAAKPRVRRMTNSGNQASAIVGGGSPCCLPEGGSERVRAAKPYRQADVCHRDGTSCQQQLGLLHATVGLIPVRRHSKRLLECAAEVVRAAETHELRQRGKRYTFVEMFFNVCKGNPLLPRSQATLDSSLNTRHPAIETQKLMYKQGT